VSISWDRNMVRRGKNQSGGRNILPTVARRLGWEVLYFFRSSLCGARFSGGRGTLACGALGRCCCQLRNLLASF